MVVQVQVVRQVVVLTRSIYRRFSLPRERQLSEASDNFSENGLCGAFPIIHERPFTDVRWDNCVVAHSGDLTFQFRAELQFWRCGLTSALDHPDMC